MKRISPDCVVFYTASQCYIYPIQSCPKALPFDVEDARPVPSDEQIKLLQQELKQSVLASSRQLLIVVPNAWLSVSEHQIAHPLSPKLAPLAALAFASETTFAPPNEIFFHHSVDKLNKDLFQLHVIACSKMLRDLLRQPFDAAQDCRLISMQQWQQRSSRRFARYTWGQFELSNYQPEEDRRRNLVRRWLVFVLLSVSLHLLILGYFYLLDRQHKQLAVTLQQQTQALSLPQKGSVFVSQLLTMLRTLPKDVRLSSLSSEQHAATAYLTLPHDSLPILLAQWRQAFPHWRWQVLPQSKLLESQEVIDVALRIFAR
ncbi:hypothetical protein [Marinomonas pollencensis]|uniref:Uncharacterized protein n=1 Tax=Marinomonas pollencensis TaxID=491954 RepID=A0A3E0DJT8_9GAMM|nr:hypothetical protein [Marinomonas pollencensis]REG82360.1 hypothetical protein DFP81_10919 [Marinomonas pollencensis]